MSTGHLSRKELQRDEVLEGAKTGLEWIEHHRRDLIRYGGGTLAVLALIGGIWGGIAWRRGASGRMVSEALARLTKDAPTAEDKAAAAKQLVEASEKYPGAPTGSAAGLHRAATLASEGKIDEAWTLTLQIADQADSGSLVDAFAEHDLVLLAPAAKKIPEAIARVNGHLDSQAPPMPKDVLLFSLGDLNERAGHAAEAKTAYRRLLTEYPESMFRGQAQQKVEDKG